MFALFFVLLGFIVSGCGEGRGAVDGEFLVYLRRFEEEAVRRGIEVDVSSVSVGFIEKPIVSELGIVFGRCRDGRVEVVREFWESGSEARRESMLFHELGHCVLKRDHRGGWNRELHAPQSVMVPDTDLVSGYWGDHRDYYLDELFSFTR